MMFMANTSCFVILICVTAYLVECGLITKRNAYQPGAMPKKRPFCNAFTGCGRKRSDTSFSNNNNDLQGNYNNNNNNNRNNDPNEVNGIDDTLGDLLDLNSEPAVEDLMRQIMSQAKMWEAIQEANREMTIQKNDRSNSNRQKFPTFNSQ